MKYREIYEFNVFDEIKRGTTVYCIDKLSKEVFNVNIMDMNAYCGLIKMVDDEMGRFEFYSMTESEEK